MCIIFEETRIKRKQEQKLKSEEEINGAAIKDQRKNKEISQQNPGFSIINTFWNKNKLAFRRHASKLLASVNLWAIASIGNGEPVQGCALDTAISAAFPAWGVTVLQERSKLQFLSLQGEVSWGGLYLSQGFAWQQFPAAGGKMLVGNLGGVGSSSPPP